MKKEKFAYEVEEGAVMDFVDGRFVLVVKDTDWNQEQLDAFSEDPCRLTFCHTNDLCIFVLEGGPVDSCDFYFNVQECDGKAELLGLDRLDFDVLLVDGNNDICWKKTVHASPAVSQTIRDCLQRQADVQFMPGEYDVNVEGMMQAYQPFELLKYAKCEVK